MITKLAVVTLVVVYSVNTALMFSAILDDQWLVAILTFGSSAYCGYVLDEAFAVIQKRIHRSKSDG